MAARIGGGEFVIILENVHDKSDIDKIAQNILATVKNVITLTDTECSLGTSIGISVYPDNGNNEDELMKKADEAMYAVKDAGRNAYRFY